MIPIVLISAAIIALFLTHYFLARHYIKAATYLNAVQTIIITIATIEKCLAEGDVMDLGASFLCLIALTT